MSARFVPRPFFGPPRVLFGSGALREAGQVLKDLGVLGGKVFLVTDVTVSGLGLSRRLAEVVEAAGFTTAEFSEIRGEPSIEVAESVVTAARAQDPVAVMGIGGGSALDMAKLAAVFLSNKGTVTEALQTPLFDRPPRPLVLIPTTAGTGAEASRNAVVIREGRKAFLGSPYLVPSAAILDPELTLTLPRKVTAYTGMDALSHCIEALLSTNGTALTDAMALQGIQIVQAYLPRAVENGSDLEARGHMLVAAYLGGLALNAGMVLGHSIAYTLANRLGIPHGLSCALALPYAMEYNARLASERLAGIARALGVEPRAEEAVRAVRALSTAVGIPQAWKDLGLPRDALPDMVDECLSLYPRPNNPRPLDRSSLLGLYEAAWEGQPYLEGGAA
jgi:alcohol dehydrogenase class IV